MNYWAIDKNLINFGGQIVIESRQRISITSHDPVVIFEREASDVTFQSHAVVHDAKIEYLPIEGYVLTASISQPQPIDPPMALSELAYSLKKIYSRYDKPTRHFTRKYVSLSEEDFGTIITGSIYWARTAFGLYINELRTEQLTRFMQDVSQSDPEVLLQRSGFDSAWSALRQFIEQEYITVAKLLEKIHAQVNHLQQINKMEIDYIKLGISSAREMDDLLHEQEELFAKFIEMTQPDNISILDSLTNKIVEEHKSEAEFEDKFRGTLWPLYPIKH
ncbi:hypothetical protein ACFLXA_01625 [Chloroflexota bacterium]